jgi:hypothetical protein
MLPAEPKNLHIVVCRTCSRMVLVKLGIWSRCYQDNLSCLVACLGGHSADQIIRGCHRRRMMVAFVPGHPSGHGLRLLVGWSI